MSGSNSQVTKIVNDVCGTLLTEMQKNFPNDAVGISIALYYPGNTEVANFFGYGSAAPNQGVTADTVYGIGSVTKVFTATLAAYLSEQGTIGNLGTTTVASYLNNSACEPSGVSGDYWDSVTFADFATQTSGMPDEAPGLFSVPLFNDESPGCGLIDWWNNNHNQTTWESDQKYWIYSSAGFVTLGFAVANAAGTGYTDLLSSVITTPLSMSNTFAADDAPKGAVLAQGYASPTQPVSVTSAADLKSTATDMATWMGAVYEAMTASTPSALQSAISSTTNVWIQQPKDQSGGSYDFAMGLGWQIPSQDSAPFLMKDGATGLGGCSCWVGLTKPGNSVPAIGVMVMTNQLGFGKYGVAPDRYGRQILDQILALG